MIVFFWFGGGFCVFLFPLEITVFDKAALNLWW